MADELKNLGNKAIAEKNFDEAISKFTEAIAIEPKNHILFSNRSAAYASKKEYENALADAENVTKLNPDWSKGWGRVGAAKHGLGDLTGAREAYEKGLKIDSNNAQIKSGLASVNRAIENEAKGGCFFEEIQRGIGGSPADGLGNVFNDPQLIQKLAANPKTSKFLADPSFMMKLTSLKNNPNATQDLFSDPRMIQVLGVLMGVDLSMMGNDDPMRASEPATNDTEQDIVMPDASTSKPSQKVEPEPENEPLDEEAAKKAESKAAADKEKELGTQQYKNRNFEEAISHYQKAWELNKDIIYLNNIGAVYFEMGDYDNVIKVCTQAIDEGREIYADFKMIAKSYARIGSAHEKKNDLESAIANYKKSLTEHRTPDTVNKLRAAEKKSIEMARAAYIDPVKAEEARELGNAKFKESDWPSAVQSYSEMIKRAPQDPRGYSNRAAAFIKLLEFPSAIDDCDEAIKRDPKFIRAYLRKAQAYFGMREYSKCLDVCTEATEVDTARAHTREIEAQQQNALQAMYSARENETEEQTKERIQRDPEILEIMQDPIMQSILQQAQSDPAALQEHMKNPGIKSKIQKLIAAGVIRVGR
ncbi:Heat shock protein sti1-like protein [Golovinomyces cichoracearum]|uniref:Heat shock protein sti1-like protein n=1 Tax=Golovinomyces cichoracearum TaxID=62708 RepID=A0A420IDP2_9PEZI|nr:Heat shock protein sti1-like protein [Golovinomyces cichoracearum]